MDDAWGIYFKPNLPLPTLLCPTPNSEGVPTPMLSCAYVFILSVLSYNRDEPEDMAGPNLPRVGGPNLPLTTSKRVQLLKPKCPKKPLTFVPSFYLHVSNFKLMRVSHNKTTVLYINHKVSVSTGFYFKRAKTHYHHSLPKETAKDFGNSMGCIT